MGEGIDIPIYEDQNSLDNLKLLAAQRHLYNVAKQIRTLTLLVSLVIVGWSIIVVNKYPDEMGELVVVSAIWTICSVILPEVAKKKSKQAVTIQETFDVKLFGLLWEMNLVGSPVPPELINNAARKLHSNPHRPLQNWYTNWSSTAKTDAEHWSTVLKCQRENLSWDWRLRRYFVLLVVTLITGLLLAEIITSYIPNLPTRTFFNGYIIPTLSLYIAGVQSIVRQSRLVELKENKANELQQILISCNPLTMQKCRDVQDFIYAQRLADCYVPNWFYRLYRGTFERDIKGI